MIKISSPEQLLECFRSLDRDQVEMPTISEFPLHVQDHHVWGDPLSPRVFLLVEDPDKRVALGVVFRHDSSGASSVGMCEWCHRVRGSGGVGLLTAAASGNRRVGVYLCRDLSCKQKLEDGPGVDDLPQIPQASEGERRVLIQRRMTAFVRRQLF